MEDLYVCKVRKEEEKACLRRCNAAIHPVCLQDTSTVRASKIKLPSRHNHSWRVNEVWTHVVSWES